MLTIGSRPQMDADTLMHKLRDPFPANDIEWRVQSSGKTQRGPWVRVLAYITNRAIMERLDAVCGIDGWRNEFFYSPSGAVLCGLSIRIDGQWITKWDGASETDIEAAKGGISGAMKRAGVQWGIGRYLYNLEEGYAKIAAEDDRNAPYYLAAKADKHGPALRWYPPPLQAWALPGGSGEPGKAPPSAQARAEKAEATLKGEHNRVHIPGTKAHFDGHGGKRIEDVPSEALVDIRDYLDGKGGYGDVVDAINLALDERTRAGA